MSLNFIWRNDKWYNKRVLIWRFTLVLIKINYGQIGDQTGLFYTTNPVFYTSGNRFVRRTGTFGNLIFSLVPSDNRNTRSTCPTSVFIGIGQTLMSRPVESSLACIHCFNVEKHCKIDIWLFYHDVISVYVWFFSSSSSGSGSSDSDDSDTEKAPAVSTLI
jgi:hypothetical protein